MWLLLLYIIVYNRFIVDNGITFKSDVNWKGSNQLNIYYSVDVAVYVAL